MESPDEAQDFDIAMISAHAYYAACVLKRAQVFVISLQDIQYQAEKKPGVETDRKSVIAQEYPNFLDVFLKKTQPLSFHIKNMIFKFI